MIGLDTNVLVRAAIKDDPGQAARAQALLSSLTLAQPGFVTHVVLVEVWWVLTRAYKQPPDLAAMFVARLCETATIVVQDQEAVTAALGRVRHFGADFVGALIVEVSKAHGAPDVQTFDQDAIHRAGMTQVQAPRHAG